MSNYRAIGNTLYLLSRVERNTYIAQTQQELLQRKDELEDSQSIMNVIKSTGSYEHFAWLDKNMGIILSDYLKEPAQEEIINAVNDIMDKNFTNYQQAQKYLSRRWNKWKKEYLTRVSKIAYDIYDRENKMLDGPEVDDDLMIRNNT